MEDRQFDELTKKLARPVSRRTVFKAAIATAVGGIGAMATFGRARAAPGPNCKGAGLGVCTLRGQFTAECCTNYCTSAGVCGCPNGQSVCNNGSGEKCYSACTGGRIRNTQTCVCECPVGQNECAGKCVNFLTDTSNCGSCGNVCPSGTVCSNGICSTTCGAGLTNCPPTGCVDLTSNPANCGTCGHACPANASCVGGTCTCLTGFVPCTTTGGTFMCVAACPNGQVPTPGTCTGCSCPTGTTACPTGTVTATTICCTSTTQTCCGTGTGQSPTCCNNGSTVCCNGFCETPTTTSTTCNGVCCPTSPPSACVSAPHTANTCIIASPTCCPTTQVCCGTSCCCQNGSACVNGFCAANTCTAGSSCGIPPAGQTCSCFTTPAATPCGGGQSVCVQTQTGVCTGAPTCENNCQCPAGTACIPSGCTAGVNSCLPFCGCTTGTTASCDCGAGGACNPAAATTCTQICTPQTDCSGFSRNTCHGNPNCGCFAENSPTGPSVCLTFTGYSFGAGGSCQFCTTSLDAVGGVCPPGAICCPSGQICAYGSGCFADCAGTCIPKTSTC